MRVKGNARLLLERIDDIYCIVRASPLNVDRKSVWKDINRSVKSYGRKKDLYYLPFWVKVKLTWKLINIEAQITAGEMIAERS